MASLVLFDRVKVGISQGGAGAITLGAATVGYQSFSQANVADRAVVPYVIEDGAGWEYGHGTYAATGTTLTRTVLGSSLGGQQPLNVSTNAVLYIALLAEDIAQFGGPPAIANCTDVDETTPPSDGQALVWSATEKKYKPGTVAASSGGGSGGGTTTPGPTIVQQSFTQADGNTGADNVATFGTPVTVGNLLVFIVVSRSGGAPSVPSGYLSQYQVSDTGAFTYFIVTREVVSGDATSFNPVSLAGNAAHDGSFIVAYEVSSAGSHSIQSQGPSSSATFSVALANLAAGTLILGGFGSNNSDGPPTITGGDTNLAYSGFIDSGEGDRASLTGLHLTQSTTGTATLNVSGANASSISNLFAIAIAPATATPGGLTYPPLTELTMTAEYALNGSGATTVIPWQSVTEDDVTAYAAGSPTRMTVPSGYTKVRFNIYMAFVNTGGGAARGLALNKNGNAYKLELRPMQYEGNCTMQTAWLRVSPGDYFEVIALTYGGSNCTTSGPNDYMGPPVWQAEWRVS